MKRRERPPDESHWRARWLANPSGRTLVTTVRAGLTHWADCFEVRAAVLEAEQERRPWPRWVPGEQPTCLHCLLEALGQDPGVRKSADD